MTERPLAIPEDRALSTQEQTLLEFLLSNAGARGQSFLSHVANARVVARCSCGCASVDFSINGSVPPPGVGLEPITDDYYWHTAGGGLCAVFAFAKANALAGLECWSVDGADTPRALPALSQLRSGRKRDGISWRPLSTPLLRQVGIGMVLGLVVPFSLGFIPTSGAQLKLSLLFGPVLGGSMAYFLHRLRRLKERHGEFMWLMISGTLAGGATAGIAFDFGYLSSPWYVLLGAGLGTVCVAGYRLLSKE